MMTEQAGKVRKRTEAETPVDGTTATGNPREILGDAGQLSRDSRGCGTMGGRTPRSPAARPQGEGSGDPGDEQQTDSD